MFCYLNNFLLYYIYFLLFHIFQVFLIILHDQQHRKLFSDLEKFSQFFYGHYFFVEYDAECLKAIFLYYILDNKTILIFIYYFMFNY